MKRLHRMPFGAEPGPRGVRFRLWAPAHEFICLALGDDEPFAMSTGEDGWHEAVSERARHGTRYSFVLPDGTRVADPASRFQPDDVHGPSEVVDPAAFDWSDAPWRGIDWHAAVIYELHLGAFTPAGTFAAAAERLPYLAELGVTLVELMPVADFPGRRNWGYDGVLWYAPDATYGRPEDFKGFVEAAHRAGIGVVLDVVYNHFGPDGNYLSLYAPAFFTARHKTPWGDAINYDGPGSEVVRAFAIENACYWLDEYHLDGLRLDAVHAIVDDSPTHLLSALAERARAVAVNRPLHLILENEANETHWLERRRGAPRWYSAQWNDDVHHVLHTAVSGESIGYYADYLGDARKLARALAEGFAFQGEPMSYRGAPRGEVSADLPPTAFVAFIQDHDQVGNRAFGERLRALASAAAVRAAAAVYLLLPQIPMLFMGEEWSSARPFPFFCDFSGDLAEAVRAGRRAEFARFPAFADARERERIPDPEADATFAAAKLDWQARAHAEHAASLRWYREILAARRRNIVPLLPQIVRAGEGLVVGDAAVSIRWSAGDAGFLALDANLGATPIDGFPPVDGTTFWSEGEWHATRALAWSVRWSMATRPRAPG